jgi:hypothetical protein
MTEFEALIAEELDALAPPPLRRPDWDAVLERARPPFHRRQLVLALAAAIALIACAAAVAAGLGDFDRWLEGAPGKPAPANVQHGFTAANGRSWAAFPTSTRLRELIRTRPGERTYILYGFRSGSLICLQLNAVTLGTTARDCVPISIVAHISAPIVPVSSDGGFADIWHYHFRPTATFSFGIVADGVRAVSARTVDGAHQAIVGGNAYLFVENDPNTANRVVSVTATGPGARRTTVPVTSSFGASGPLGPLAVTAPPGRRARGPTRVEKAIRHPKVGWFMRGERRGLSLESAKLTPTQRQALAAAAGMGGLRLVKPDPFSDVIVGLAGNVCFAGLVGSHGGSIGCSPPKDFFSQGPIPLGGLGTGSQTIVLAGVAADGISRLTLFLTGGEREFVPLRDNLFAISVARSQFPVRVVGYDRRGRVVAIQTPKWLLPEVVPKRARVLQRVLRVRGPEGAAAVLRVSPHVRGIHCWRVAFSTGESRGACVPRISGPSTVQLDVLQPAGRDIFVVGTAGVPRVELRVGSAVIASTRPVRGHFVLAVPRPYLDGKRYLALLRGVNGFGVGVQRQALFFRAQTRAAGR